MDAPDSFHIQLWRLVYAGRSFDHVVVICDYIVQAPIAEESPLFYPMITAAYALYARPFKKNRVIGRFPDEIIPKEFLELHQQIIAMRDEILVHSDADPSISLSGFAGNNVRIFLDGNGRLDVAPYEVKPRLSLIRELRILAAALKDSVDVQFSNLVDANVSKLPSFAGEYEIDLMQQEFVAVEPVRGV